MKPLLSEAMMPFNRILRVRRLLTVITVALIAITLLFLGCNSLPPTSPSRGNSDFFDPRLLTWENAEIPIPLTGNWYESSNLLLYIANDTIQITDIESNEWHLAESESYYRISYKQGDLYRALFINLISPDSLRLIESDSGATELEDIASVAATGCWRLLTSGKLWKPIALPYRLKGSWHLSEGVMELEIGDSLVVLDGEAWALKGVQSNRNINRLLMEQEDSTMVIYYDASNLNDIQVLPDGPGGVSQDRYGNVSGNWITLKKWYDFLEITKLHDGRSISYYYDFSSTTLDVSNSSSPQDSLIEKRHVDIRMLVQVFGEITGNGEGELTIYVSFGNGTDSGLVHHSRTDGGTEILADSSWQINSVSSSQTIYTVVMENDTLWTVYPEGKEFFASRKLDIDSRINLKMFAYPFDPPLARFPDEDGLYASCRVLYGTAPEPELFSIGSDAIQLGNDEDGIRYIYGGVKHSIVELDASKGLRKIQYSLGRYNRRYWERDPGYTNPFVHEASFVADFRISSP